MKRPFVARLSSRIFDIVSLGDALAVLTAEGIVLLDADLGPLQSLPFSGHGLKSIVTLADGRLLARGNDFASLFVAWPRSRVLFDSHGERRPVGRTRGVRWQARRGRPLHGWHLLELRRPPPNKP